MAKGVSIEVPLYPFAFGDAPKVQGVILSSISYGERGELPLVIRWRKQRIAFLPLYPFAFTKGDRRRTYPFGVQVHRGTG